MLVETSNFSFEVDLGCLRWSDFITGFLSLLGQIKDLSGSLIMISSLPFYRWERMLLRVKGERGTGVWERVYSGNPQKNSNGLRNQVRE